MSGADDIRLTAEGLVRNFGDDAGPEAVRTARRCASRKDKAATAFWEAVIREIADIDRQRAP